MAKISLYDIFTGSNTTKWLEPDVGVSLEYSDDRHSVIIGLTGTGPGGTIDIGLDPNPTLGGNLNLNGYSIISGPGQNIPLQPGVGGEIILDGLTFPTVDGNSGDLLGTDGNGHLVWFAVPGISNSQPGLTYYVDGSVSTTGDGSKETPFKTVAEAVSMAVAGDTVVIYSGTYSENLTLTESLYFKAIDNADVTIFGKFIVPVSVTVETTGIKFENNVDQMIVNDGTMTINGGSLVRDNVTGITNNGTMVLRDSLIKTVIDSFSSIRLYNVDSDGGLVTTRQLLVVYSAIKSPMINHIDGLVELRNSPAIDVDDTGALIGLGVSLKSTSNNDSLLIDNVSFKQVSGWSKINKTGNCGWIINNVGRNPLSDVLSGPRLNFTTEASDLSSYYNPEHYEIPSNVSEVRDIKEASITEHLIGIDAKLGQATSTIENVLWVASNGSDLYDGSYNQPFASISKAILMASTGQCIVVSSGLYTGETIVVDKNLMIIGFGEATLTDSTIEVINSSHLIMDHINISSSSNTFVTTLGSFKIFNSHFDSPSHAISISQLSADSSLIDCDWSGDLQNSDSSGHKLTISGVSSTSSKFLIDGNNSKTYIRDSSIIGHVQHDAGFLSLINVGQIVADGSGESITSPANTANNGYLYLNQVSTKQDSGSYGKIEKTGDGDYHLGINDLGTNDTFNGNGQIGSISSDQVSVNYTPSSYTSTNVLTDHIEQIDQLLGQAVIRPTRLYYVDEVDQLNDIYMAITESTFGFDSTIYITPGAIAQFMLHDNFEFKPGINLIGTGSAENVIVQMPITIPNLIITSATSGMVHETLWRDIKLNSPTIVNMTLADDELHFENMTINGDITVNSGRVIIRNSKINGVITITGGSLELCGCELLENVTIGAGSLYINGVKQFIDSSNASFNISGGSVIINDIVASNIQAPIFRITGGKTIVSTVIIDSLSYDTVINQDIGGQIYLGTNNIVAEGKTVIGTVLNLGFGL